MSSIHSVMHPCEQETTEDSWAPGVCGVLENVDSESLGSASGDEAEMAEAFKEQLKLVHGSSIAQAAQLAAQLAGHHALVPRHVVESHRN